MPGLRRLFDVGSKISGALGAPRAEGAEQGSDEPMTAPQDDAAATPERPADAADAAPATAAVPAAAPEGGDAPAEPPAEEPEEPDPACVAAVELARAAAVELARAAAVEVGGTSVGEHQGAYAEPALPGEHVVTHAFAASLPGYVGWRWAVTVARAGDDVTVDETVLLPGEGAVLAPPWVPWSDRVQPDDLGPGDLLPPPDHDPRLVPSHEDVAAERLPFDLHRELGQGRPRVLSAYGRGVAAERWFDGEGGPGSARARQAPGHCVDCGFFVRLTGDLGRMFGVCANGVAPDDGRVVALSHGCGAHSETVTTAAHANTTELVVEHEELELVTLHAGEE